MVVGHHGRNVDPSESIMAYKDSKIRTLRKASSRRRRTEYSVDKYMPMAQNILQSLRSAFLIFAGQFHVFSQVSVIHLDEVSRAAPRLALTLGYMASTGPRSVVSD